MGDRWRLVTQAYLLPAKDAANAVQREIPVLCHARKEEVEHDDRDKAGYEALRAGAADAAGSRARGKPFVAGDERDRSAEEKTFHEAFIDRPEIHAQPRELPIRLIGHAQR